MKKIEMYTSDTCPNCTKLKEYLNQNNIEYIDKLSKEEIWTKINEMRSDDEFRKQTKTSSSSRSRVVKKIEIANHYFSEVKEKSEESIEAVKQLEMF